jgi:2-dehydro-3-deoxyphosphogluconate aldolase / (4S)-4-hydroxy-2-oxoglutarate aldolase
MKEIDEQLGKIKVIPVVVIDRADDAVPLAEALMSGGLPCAEVTFRTAAGAQAVRRLSAMPGLLLGAGTVLSVDQVKQAMDAGASFIVTPGFNPSVVAYCVDNGIVIVPGVCTPTEVDAALALGVNTVKFFPAESFGGVGTLRAISAPYPMMRFVPTGGIGPSNLMSYLRFDKVLACGGSWMVAKDLIASRNFAEVTRLSKQAMELVRAG